MIGTLVDIHCYRIAISHDLQVVNKRICNMKKSDSANHSGKKRHRTLKFAFFLLLVAGAVLLWANIKIKAEEKEMNTMENRFTNEKKQLVNLYDSMAITDMELTARVFSWAIRSAMINENLEQVNEYFVNFIKEPGISKVQLIDAPSARVLISTDKKDEGKAVTESSILEAETTHHINSKGPNEIIVSPVMGLNSKIGILVIEKKKIEKADKE